MQVRDIAAQFPSTVVMLEGELAIRIRPAAGCLCSRQAAAASQSTQSVRS